MARRTLAGQVVVITGGARGIGRATAVRFAAHGAHVVLADLDAGAAESARTELPGAASTRSYALDVADEAAFAAVIDAVERDVGPVDVLVNNAGVMSVGPFLAESDATSRRQFDINVHGVANGLRAVLPRMLQRKRGHIVNVASVAGVLGTPHVAMYSATKHAVVGLTEAVRREHEGSGVELSYVCPSLVDTELTSGTGRPAWPPLLRPDDVADAIVRCVTTGAVRVFVPGGTKLSVLIPALLPRAVYERIGRWFRIDAMFAHVDPNGRDAYRRRSGVK